MRSIIGVVVPSLIAGALFAACGDEESSSGWTRPGAGGHSDASAGAAGWSDSGSGGGSGAGHAGADAQLSQGGAGGGMPDGAAGGAEAGEAGAAQAGAAGQAGAEQGGAAGAQGGACGVVPGGSGGAPQTGPCSFPQGVPEEGFIGFACVYQDTDPSVDAAVNNAMAGLSGCSVGSVCVITGFPGTTVEEICQSWFAAVTEQLRAAGYCAGQHQEGGTDEIAVSQTGCTGKWFGYHICNYAGGKVVWNPGARRGWWVIDPQYCP